MLERKYDPSVVEQSNLVPGQVRYLAWIAIRCDGRDDQTESQNQQMNHHQMRHTHFINIEGYMHGTCIPSKVILGSGYHKYKNHVHSYMITGTVLHSPYMCILCAY